MMFFCFGKSSPVCRLLSASSAQPLQLLSTALVVCFLAIPAQAASESAVILAEASKAFSGNKPISSVEMTGRATWTAGSDKQEGSARLIAKSTGENLAEFDLGNGIRIEKQSAITTDRMCSWSGKDGVEHDVNSPNCWTATTWFLPHLALQEETIPNLVVLANMTKDKQSKLTPHIYHALVLPAPQTDRKQSLSAEQLIQNWSATDIALDPQTALPASLRYTIYSDDGIASLSVEVRYSSYKSISGVEIPMHIERYVNGSIQVSLDIDTAAIN